MAWASFHTSRTALASYLLLWGSPTLAQPEPAWVDPPSHSNSIGASETSAPARSIQTLRPMAPARHQSSTREEAARDLAFRYLSLWSAPQRVTLASASSFYGSTLRFHGRSRTLASVIAEKRRFAARWPHRTYRHRPETTQVACEGSGARCTVRSSFDFEATNPRQDRRSLGIGEHDLVVSFASGRPVIEAEDSRVIIRGQGNMTSLLGEGL